MSNPKIFVKIVQESFKMNLICTLQLGLIPNVAQANIFFLKGKKNILLHFSEEVYDWKTK